VPPSWLGYALAAVLAAWLLIVLAARWYRAAAASSRARRRAARALAGEHEAEPLLADHGYRIVGRQLPLRWTIAVDGEPCDIDLRVDFIVERDARRFVAEVKTGRAAPAIANAATRRQLLEYLVAYRVDSVLLVDADAGSVTEVEFTRPSAAFSRDSC
jgi:hypothetical protein